jgi:hypothetical protein
MGLIYEEDRARRPAAPAREHDPRNRRQCICFQSNVPEKVALAYPDGVLKGGMYGPRVMYTLTDGRLMFLDPEIAAKIKNMGIPHQQEFWICKRKPAGRGQHARWDVYLEDPTPHPQETPLERDLRLSINQAQRQRPSEVRNSAPSRPEPPEAARSTTQPEAKEITLVESNPAGRKHARWAETLINHTNQLVDAYSAALRHAGTHGLAVKPEDVRTFLVTAFINLSKSGGRSAA